MRIVFTVRDRKGVFWGRERVILRYEERFWSILGAFGDGAVAINCTENDAENA